MPDFLKKSLQTFSSETDHKSVQRIQNANIIYCKTLTLQLKISDLSQ